MSKMAPLSHGIFKFTDQKFCIAPSHVFILVSSNSLVSRFGIMISYNAVRHKLKRGYDANTTTITNKKEVCITNNEEFLNTKGPK